MYAWSDQILSGYGKHRLGGGRNNFTYAGADRLATENHPAPKDRSNHCLFVGRIVCCSIATIITLETDYHRVCIFSLMRLIEFRNFVVTDLACKFPTTLEKWKEEEGESMD